jgi:GNAT superfamily N-acetyltransferase
MAEPEWLRAGVGDLLLDQLTSDLREMNAIVVWHRNYAQLTGVLDFLAERGFSEADRVWDLRLDVAAFDPAPLEAAREGVVAAGIEIVTFAEESGRDPGCLRKLHGFLNTVKADDPRRQPFTPEPFEAAERWCASAAFIPDACFIAKRDGEYVGFTDLINYEQCAGGITQGFTGVAREHRRQGVATALKLRAIEYARRHKYQAVRAFIYPSQTSVLALNEKLGFSRTHSYVTLEKCLREVSRIDPRVYEAYVGEYAPDPDVLAQNRLPAALSLTIKKVGEHLISEVRDMQDRLLPESETTFFTTHHYGRFEFVKNARGQVTHLIYREPGFEARARKIRRMPE